jgi:hypothetical protein
MRKPVKRGYWKIKKMVGPKGVKLNRHFQLFYIKGKRKYLIANLLSPWYFGFKCEIEQIQLDYGEVRINPYRRLKG